MKNLTAVEKREVFNYIISKNRLKDYYSDSLWVTCAAKVLQVSLIVSSIWKGLDK